MWKQLSLFDVFCCKAVYLSCLLITGKPIRTYHYKYFFSSFLHEFLKSKVYNFRDSYISDIYPKWTHMIGVYLDRQGKKFLDLRLNTMSVSIWGHRNVFVSHSERPLLFLIYPIFRDSHIERKITQNGHTWKVSILGPPGEKTFVTLDSSPHVCLRSQEWRYNQFCWS